MSVEPQPRIARTNAKELIGIHLRMSLAADATPTLWGEFMPRRGEIEQRAGTDLISLRTFTEGVADPFAPTLEFDKYALAEVERDSPIPNDCQIQRINLNRDRSLKSYPRVITRWMSTRRKTSGFQFVTEIKSLRHVETHR